MSQEYFYVSRVALRRDCLGGHTMAAVGFFAQSYRCDSQISLVFKLFSGYHIQNTGSSARMEAA